jgi:predicted 3-demethylubiquinone-9 3-methyltransferase (glyoxalase superfamily)
LFDQVQGEDAMPIVTPFLWFNHNAEEAMRFYVSVFPNSELLGTSPLVVRARLDGQEVIGLNGGPQFSFTEAFSFFITCKTQEEVDRYWSALTANGGKPGRCGWLKDKYGLSWQVVPTVLNELMQQGGERSKRVMDAMMQMEKLDIERLRQAGGAA